MRDWLIERIDSDWTERDIAGLPFLENEPGRRFYYAVAEGGHLVNLYLPSGRRVRHAITPLAARDSEQLEAEVMALLTDTYPSTT